MAPPLPTIQSVSCTFGVTPLLDGADLTVAADEGERFLHPGATVRYLPQDPHMSGHATVMDYVTDGLASGDDPHRATYLLEQLGLTGAESTKTLSGGEARRAHPPHPLARSRPHPPARQGLRGIRGLARCGWRRVTRRHPESW